MAYLPCQNPDCRSHGKPHPNCHCYDHITGSDRQWAESHGYQFPGTTKGLTRRGVRGGSYAGVKRRGGKYKYMAEGGEVDSHSHYCSMGMPHRKDCEYYASGGEVKENKTFHENPELALDHAIIENGLLHILTKTGRSKSEDPGKIPLDFIHSSKKGSKTNDLHASHFFNEKADRIKSNHEDIEGLKNHLKMLETDPNAALEVGGSLGDHLPDHNIKLAAKLAAVNNYFQSIKPMSQQLSPLDKPASPSKAEEYNYNRQLENAQNPMLVYQKAKDGILRPNDIKMMQSIYPELYKSMTNKITEHLINHKSQEKNLSRNQKRSAGMFLGQELSFVHSPISVQSIIKANAGAESETQKPSTSNKKASAVELKQINKVNDLYKTPDQARQIDQKS